MKTWAPLIATGGAIACFADTRGAAQAPFRLDTGPDGGETQAAVAAAGSSPTSTDAVPTVVVVGVDDEIDDVVVEASRRAVARRARLMLVHAHRGVASRADGGSLGAHVVAATAALRSAGVPATYELRAGRPAAVLSAVAREVGADVIVIGSRPPKPARRRIGRLARTLGRSAPCSVVVVARLAAGSRRAPDATDARR